MIAHLKFLAATALIAATASTAFAQAPFPNRQVHIIVNSAPGANLDLTARLIAQKMTDVFGRTVIVENKPGADGLIGIQYVKNAAPDGYTILLTSNNVAYAQAFKIDPGFDLEKDFTGVGSITRLPFVMVGSVDQAAKNLQEFVAQAKANPGQMSFASGGVGTATFLPAAMLFKQAGVNVLHVPYKGVAAAASDVMAGRVNAVFDGLITAGPQVGEGKLRAFGVSSPNRVQAFPNIPTIAEQGFPGFSYISYVGLFAPAATPKDVIAKLNETLRGILTNDAVRSTFASQGSETWPQTPEEFNRALKQDAEQVQKLVTDLGIPKQ